MLVLLLTSAYVFIEDFASKSNQTIYGETERCKLVQPHTARTESSPRASRHGTARSMIYTKCLRHGTAVPLNGRARPCSHAVPYSAAGHQAIKIWPDFGRHNWMAKFRKCIASETQKVRNSKDFRSQLTPNTKCFFWINVCIKTVFVFIMLGNSMKTIFFFWGFWMG